MADLRESGKRSKSERTRARILEAAESLIVERSDQDFQMAEVAERCGMSKGSLYYYFPDRDAIVEELFTQASDEFAARLEGVVVHSHSSEEAIRSLIRTYCEAVRDNRLFVVAMAYELHRGQGDMLPELRERYGRISHLAAAQLERAKTEGLVRADVKSSQYTDAICGAILFGAALAARAQGSALDVDALADSLYDFVMSGVGAR